MISYHNDDFINAMKRITREEMRTNKDGKKVSPVVYWHKMAHDMGLVDTQKQFSEMKQDFIKQGIVSRKDVAKDAKKTLTIDGKTYNLKWWLFSYAKDSSLWAEKPERLGGIDPVLLFIGGMAWDGFAYVQLTEQ